MKTLLMIDDEVKLLEVFEKFLSKKGYRVLTATSGEKGLRIAQLEKPDLIVLDLRMPKMDGIETLKRLRKKDKDTKVIMLTAFGTANYLRVTSDLGISDFISKPFDLHALLDVITSTLGES